MTENNGSEAQALRAALRKAEAELQRFREAEESRKHLVEVLNEVMPGQKYIAELAKRGINIRIT